MHPFVIDGPPTRSKLRGRARPVPAIPNCQLLYHPWSRQRQAECGSQESRL